MTQTFVELLEDFARTANVPQLAPVMARLRRSVRVAVVGRRGVGRRTVARALRLRGVPVVSDVSDVADVADVVVLVVAEAVKREDEAVLRSAGRPVLVVLTKADLSGAGPGGPMAVANRRAAAVRVRTGTPTVPLVGLLAACDGLDDAEVAALQAFTHAAPDLTSVDAFVDGDHPVGRDVRERLAERLDRFGVAHAVLALAAGCDPAELLARLHLVSNVAEVSSLLVTIAAPVRYRRLQAAIAELVCLAIELDDARLFRFLALDDTALATMSAAVDVVEAAGLQVDRGDHRAAHLARARHWRRYGRGPVDALHRSCGDDIVRGSLRLLAISK